MYSHQNRREGRKMPMPNIMANNKSHERVITEGYYPSPKTSRSKKSRDKFGDINSVKYSGSGYSSNYYVVRER